MNRRQFIGSIVAAPAIGVAGVVAAKEKKPCLLEYHRRYNFTSPIHVQPCKRYHILTADEIQQIVDHINSRSVLGVTRIV